MTTPLKKFRVTITETRLYDFLIDAESDEAARDIAMSGNLDFDVDSVRQESMECEVLMSSEESN